MNNPRNASTGTRAGTGGSIPRRPYGNGGIKLSVIGFGGIVVMQASQDAANRIVAHAVERGINYFDVAPSYDDAEARLGPALAPYRKDVFLACKTTERTAAGAARELAGSLKRLRTDWFDLYQFHAVNDVKGDVDAIFAKGGAMEAVQAARKDGRVRHVGFSSHTVEGALAMLDRYEFDSVMFPVNFTCWFNGGFGPQVMAKAKAVGTARLALKALARQKWPAGKADPQRKKHPKCWYQPVTDREEAELAIRWTLSQDITAAPSPGDESLLLLAMDIASDLKPITPEQEDRLRKLAGTLDPLFA